MLHHILAKDDVKALISIGKVRHVLATYAAWAWRAEGYAWEELRFGEVHEATQAIGDPTYEAKLVQVQIGIAGQQLGQARLSIAREASQLVVVAADLERELGVAEGAEDDNQGSKSYQRDEVGRFARKQAEEAALDDELSAFSVFLGL
jgi:hypothetical protein